MSASLTNTTLLSDEVGGLASSFEKVEAIITFPTLYELADAIPDKPHAGRPRDYPKHMWLIYHALVNFVWQSARRVEAEIAHPKTWNYMRDLVRRQFPDDPGMWLPPRPMRRWHYTHACKYLRDQAVLSAMKDIHRVEAGKLALELGLFGASGEMSWTHPSPDRFMQADGKVITPLFKAKPGKEVIDRVTGEIRSVRSDPDASLHTEGGGNAAFGNKVVVVAARNEHDRVLLDFEHDPGRKGEGGEAAVAMRCLERLAPILPGAQGVNYDKAMRGTHIDDAMRNLGWLIMTKVHEVKEGDRLVERHLEDVSVKLPDGRSMTVSIFTRDGAAGIKELTESGDPFFIPLERIKTERRGGAGGYRFYNVYKLPPEYGGGTCRLRLTGNEEDASRGLNRAERLRAIPPSDPDFQGLFRRRNDVESLNRGIEDSLYWHRAHSVGAVAQEADLLGFALGLNALSRYRHRKREAARAAPTAA